MKWMIVFVLAMPMAAAQDWYTKAVKSVETSIIPATAKPGETVTFRITVEVNDSYHTYPTVQPDKNAASMVNGVKWPEDKTLIFVGTVKEPEKPEIVAEPLLGIKALHRYHGIVVYERPAVVSPKAAQGETTIELKQFALSVCDANSCYGPKKLTPSAKLTIKGDAVPVEKQYAPEVEKALK